jgi:hypothetical protein
MTLKDPSAWISKTAVGVLTAVLIAGGTSIIAAAKTNSVQDQRIQMLENDRARMDRLSEKLDETNRNVAVLNALLKEKHEPSN